AYVNALYEDVLGRQVDPLGLAFWQGLLSEGATPTAVVLAILASPEASVRALNGNYVAYLSRPPDLLGELAWVGVLANHPDLYGLVAVDFLSSAEYFVRA